MCVSGCSNKGRSARSLSCAPVYVYVFIFAWICWQMSWISIVPMEGTMPDKAELPLWPERRVGPVERTAKCLDLQTIGGRCACLWVCWWGHGFSCFVPAFSPLSELAHTVPPAQSAVHQRNIRYYPKLEYSVSLHLRRIAQEESCHYAQRDPPGAGPQRLGTTHSILKVSLH